MSTGVQQGNHGEPAFQFIALGKLHESAHNPRQHFDQAKLEELAANITEVGILNPLLVRPVPAGVYEIAAGHRRYRASKLAKLDKVPCLIREMTDEQFMKVLTVENLQREDVHPLDEAKGYEALMAPPYRLDKATIAKMVGRSVSYINDSVKLLNLCKEAQELFWAKKIEKGHAVLLARISQADQQRCIDTDGLMRDERTLYHERSSDKKDKWAGMAAVTVDELRDWIKRRVRFDFKNADQMLYPETVTAVQSAAEEGRKIVEITREYLAHDDVRSAGPQRVYGERAWKRADGKEKSKTCEYAVLGVIASGGDRGQSFDVCTRKDKCLVHWGKEIKARQKAQKTGGTAVAKQEKREQSKWDKEREERARKEQAWKAALPQVMAAVAEIIMKAPVKGNSALGSLICEAVSSHPKAEALKLVKRGTTAEDLVRHVAFLVLYEEATDWMGYEEFPKTAKSVGIDMAKLLPAKNHPAGPAAAQKKKGRAA